MASSLLLVKDGDRWVEPERFPHVPDFAITRRKLLESRQLAVLQNGAFLPAFGQERHWAQIGNSLRQLRHRP